tara:strand:+ start:129 stop:392 length:264 start_codon:yes stop_codon:yes gene_type:complete
MAYYETPKFKDDKEVTEKKSGVRRPLNAARKGPSDKTTVDAKYGKKNSDYRPGRPLVKKRTMMEDDGMGPDRVPAIEESLYKKDELG